MVSNNFVELIGSGVCSCFSSEFSLPLWLQKRITFIPGEIWHCPVYSSFEVHPARLESLERIRAMRAGVLNNEGWAVGLSNSHTSPAPVISPDTGEALFVRLDEWGDCEIRPELFHSKNDFVNVQKPCINLTLEASLVQVKTLRVTTSGMCGGGVRKAISHFSAGSRRRLMRTLAKVRRVMLPVFVTLTYPDDFPEFSSKWKRDIDVLGKRFRRIFEGGSFLWRMEIVKRKSGENEGKFAPHFHLLVWGVDYEKLKDWFALAWYEVVGSGDEKHLRAGTRVEKVRSWRGVMSYASKYLAKLDNSQYENVGRWWGIVSRGLVPWGEDSSIDLTERQAVILLRWLRKFIGLGGYSNKSLTGYTVADRWLVVVKYVTVHY
jgi:hypothetical protein